MTQLRRILSSCLTPADIEVIHEQMYVHPKLQKPETGAVTRAEIAQALNMVLFHGLIQRVAVAQEYIAQDVLPDQRQVIFDHGALRTVLWSTGNLPPGEAAFTRFLRPLGFELKGTYPLEKLRMTGRAYCHQDLPEDIAQFFISELHPQQFSEAFQAAATRVLSTSRDPLGPEDIGDLEQLARDGELPLTQVIRLLPKMVGCFTRHHAIFALADYKVLLAESAEMAWIATEGNAFNHATDRVSDVDTVAERQRSLGRPIKEKVEVSRSGRVRQTAFRAVTENRHFITDEGCVVLQVPGSFYEFITRANLEPAGPPQSTTRPGRLDLTFDSGNATGIFGMTAAGS